MSDYKDYVYRHTGLMMLKTTDSSTFPVPSALLNNSVLVLYISLKICLGRDLLVGTVTLLLFFSEFGCRNAIGCT